MIFTPTPLAGSYVIGLEPFSDERGWFARTFCRKDFAQIGHAKEWVQMNHSFTAMTGTIRGMHFQIPPYREIKMVRCIVGAIYDVIVDLRQHSDGYLQWYGIELSAANKKMLYIPEGFAHGFQVLHDNSELIYHHSEFYTPGQEGGLRYDDPLIGIRWPLTVSLLSARDAAFPLLNESFKGI